MRLSLGCLPLVLSACAQMVPATMAQLGAMSPLTADPGQIEVVLILPPGLDVPPGAARLAAKATRDGETLEGQYALATDTVPLANVDLPKGAQALRFRLTSADAERMRAFQAQAGAWEAADPRGTSGSISVALSGCRLGDGPQPDARASVLIRTAPDGPLLPLFRDAPLREVIGAATLDALPPCDGPI